MKSLFLIFTISVISACSSKGEVKSKQASLYFGAGTQSLMQQQYTEALTSLLKANELDPNNSDIINNLAMAYYFKGEHDLAIKSLNRSLEINSNNTDAKVNLASIYLEDGQVDKAEDLYKKVLGDLTYDKQARTLYNLATIEQKRQNLTAAAEYYKRSIKEDPNYCPSHFQIGLMQYKRRQFNSAYRSFKESSMGTCYESPAPVYYQALTLIELNKFNEARIKLDSIETRFKKTKFAVNARAKLIEINEKEIKQQNNQTHASGRVIDSPDF